LDLAVVGLVVVGLVAVVMAVVGLVAVVMAVVGLVEVVMVVQGWEVQGWEVAGKAVEVVVQQVRAVEAVGGCRPPGSQCWCAAT
jgi:hypothetical protein